MQGVSPRALEFAILCASRSNEVRGARWEEFDLNSLTWTIPGGFVGRMKEEREHQVPLPARAVEIITFLTVMPVGPFVFPGSKEGRPLSDMSLTAVLGRMGHENITVHGFRATFRMWCGDNDIASREIAEMCLAHAVGNRVELAYNRSTALERRRSAMKTWAEYCGSSRASAMDEDIRINDLTNANLRKLAYRIDEACYALAISRTSLYQLVKTGEVRLIKIAGRSLVPASELERLTRPRTD